MPIKKIAETSRKPGYQSSCFRVLIPAVFLLSCLVFPVKGFSETGEGEEELSVNLNVKGIGSSEIPALYKDQEIYLSVIDVFNFLKIKNSYTESLDSVNGKNISSSRVNWCAPMVNYF
jgi:hypothetical protein